MKMAVELPGGGVHWVMDADSEPEPVVPEPMPAARVAGLQRRAAHLHMQAQKLRVRMFGVYDELKVMQKDATALEAEVKTLEGVMEER